MSSIRQQVMDNHVSAVAAIDGIMGAIDEPPLDIASYETPPAPRPTCGVQAHPFAFCFESEDEEAPINDAFVGLTGWSLVVVDEVAYRFDGYGEDAYKRKGRRILALLQAGVMADPNCGGLAHNTAELGNGIYLVPGTTNLAVAQVRWGIEYTRNRRDPDSREATL